MAKTLDEMELRGLLGLEATAAAVSTPYTANARYLSSLDGFNIKRPPVPAHVFRSERDRALDPRTPTGLIPLDLAPVLALDGPATTPLVLACYARIRAGETLATELVASAELYYVIAGHGRTTFGPAGGPAGGPSDRPGGGPAGGEGGEPRGPGVIVWGPGDVFCVPGGGRTTHHAGGRDALLWFATNEPALRLERCRPPRPEAAPIVAAHYPAAEIRRQLLEVYLDPRGVAMPGKSVNFGNAAIEASRTTTPSFTLAMNSLLPGEAQRAHRHNAVAVTLVVAGRGCYSLIDGQRVDWEPDVVMITPPTELHSHHNQGDDVGLFLIVQDGGLYYHCRTMGFSFT